MRPQNSSLSFASLFSGCGGFDLGFISEGFNSAGGYDIDPDAVANFRNNIEPRHAFQVDLTGVVPKESELYGIDVLIAGPPCQGFSTAGKRNVDDDRNHLLLQAGHIALRIKPKVLVVENVVGALSGAHAKYWHGLDSLMRLGGYNTHTLRCQTTDLGMAQNRKRILFFAWRTNFTTDFDMPAIPHNNLRSALANISGVANHRPQQLDKNSKEYKIAKVIKQGQKLSNVRGGENAVATWDIPHVFGETTEHEKTVLEMLRRLRRQSRQRDFGDADPVSLDRLEAALGGPFHQLVESLILKGYVKRVDESIDLVGTFNGKFRRLSWDKPACTVDTRFGSPRYFLHPTLPRGFTVREAARIQGFPDSYVFSGSEASHYRLIGNAVPPPLGRLAARYVKQLLGVDP